MSNIKIYITTILWILCALLILSELNVRAEMCVGLPLAEYQACSDRNFDRSMQSQVDQAGRAAADSGAVEVIILNNSLNQDALDQDINRLDHDLNR